MPRSLRENHSDPPHFAQRYDRRNESEEKERKSETDNRDHAEWERGEGEDPRREDFRLMERGKSSNRSSTRINNRNNPPSSSSSSSIHSSAERTRSRYARYEHQGGAGPPVASSSSLTTAGVGVVETDEGERRGCLFGEKTSRDSRGAHELQDRSRSAKYYSPNADGGGENPQGRATTPPVGGGEGGDEGRRSKRRRETEKRQRRSTSRSRSGSYGKRWQVRRHGKIQHSREVEEVEQNVVEGRRRRGNERDSSRILSSSPHGSSSLYSLKEKREEEDTRRRRGKREEDGDSYVDKADISSSGGSSSSPRKKRYRVDSEDRRREREKQERARKLEEDAQLISASHYAAHGEGIEAGGLPPLPFPPSDAPSSYVPPLPHPSNYPQMVPPWGDPQIPPYSAPMMWGGGGGGPQLPYMSVPPYPPQSGPAGFLNHPQYPSQTNYFFYPPPQLQPQHENPFYPGYPPVSQPPSSVPLPMEPSGFASSSLPPPPFPFQSFSFFASPLPTGGAAVHWTPEEREKRAAEAQKRRERINALRFMGHEITDIHLSPSNNNNSTNSGSSGGCRGDGAVKEEKEEDPTQPGPLSPSSASDLEKDIDLGITMAAKGGNLTTGGGSNPDYQGSVQVEMKEGQVAPPPQEDPVEELKRLITEELEYLQLIGTLPPNPSPSCAGAVSDEPPSLPPPPPRNLPPPEEFVPVIPSSLLQGEFKSFFSPSHTRSSNNNNNNNNNNNGQEKHLPMHDGPLASGLPSSNASGDPTSFSSGPPIGEGKEHEGEEGNGGEGGAGLPPSAHGSGAMISLQAPKIAPEAERLAREARRAHVSNFPFDATVQELVDFFRQVLPQVRREITLREMKALADLLDVPEEERLTLPAQAQTSHIDIIRDFTVNTAKSKRFAFIEVNFGDIITELVALSTAVTTTGVPNPLLQYIDPKTKKAYPICIRRPRDYGVLDGVDETKVVMAGFPPTMPEDKLKEALSQFGEVKNFDVKDEFAYGEFSSRSLALQCRENLHGVMLANRMLVVFPLYDWLKVGCHQAGINVTIEEGDPISGKAVMQRVVEEAKQDRIKKKVAETQGVLALVQESTDTPQVLMKGLLSMTLNMHDVVLRLSAFYPHLQPLYGSTQVTIYPTRVVALLNLFDEKELEMDHTYSALRDQIEREVEEYGRVDRMVIPRRLPPPRPPRAPLQEDFSSEAEFHEAVAGHEEKKKIFKEEMDHYYEEQLHPVQGGYGNVYIVYHTVEEAQWAQQMLVGKQFSGRTVVTSFLYEDWILTPEEMALGNPNMGMKPENLSSFSAEKSVEVAGTENMNKEDYPIAKTKEAISVEEEINNDLD